MGRLIYGSGGQSFDVDDRLLAHLRVVFMNKLRRAEPFMFQRPDAVGTRSIWIHPAMPLVFQFYGSRPPQLNREWIAQLIADAGTADGLTVRAEVDSSADPAGF